MRLLRDGTSIGAAGGQRFAFAPDGSLTASPLDHDGRIRFLIEELGVAEDLARRLPDDQSVPPRSPDPP